LVKGADIVFETTLFLELPGISHEFAPLVMDVVAMHGEVEPIQRQPILFMKEYEFSTIGEGWQFRR
jgi:hypothetical protein